MKSNLKFVFLTGLFVGLSSILSKTYAQEQSLSIYPPVIEVQTTPPSSPSVPIVIHNNSNSDVYLKIDLIPLRQNGATGTVIIDPTLSDKGFYKYYEDRTQFLLENKKISSLMLEALETKEINLNINILEGDPPGDYYYAVTFISEASGPNDTSSARLPNGLATNLLLSIGPKDKSTGGINEFKTDRFLAKGPVEFNLKIHNSSKHLIQPSGNIEISNMFGLKIGSVEILPQYILSGSDRYMVDTIQASGEARLAYNDTNNTPKVIWPEKFLLGIYKAKAIIELEEGGRKIEAITYFFSFPLYFFIPIVIFIFITVGIYLRVRKKI